MRKKCCGFPRIVPLLTLNWVINDCDLDWFSVSTDMNEQQYQGMNGYMERAEGRERRDDDVSVVC